MKLLIKYSLISIMLLCAITLFLLCGTEKGLMLDLEYLIHFLPGKIKIEHVSGTLFSEFSIQTISYQNADQRIAIKSLNVKWNPRQLFVGKLAFETVSIKEAHIQLMDNSAEKQSMTTIDAIQKKLERFHFITFKQLIIENSSLQKDKQWITLQGKIDQNWDMKWNIYLPNMHAFIADINGSLQGTGTVSGPRLIPTIYLSLQGKQLAYGKQKISNLNALANIVLQPEKNSSLLLQVSGIKLDDYLFEKLDLNATGNVKHVKKALSTSLELNISKRFKLNMNLTLPIVGQFHPLKQPVIGNISFTATDLSMLDKLIPDIKDSRGILNGKVILHGTLANLKFSTNLKLTNGSFSLPSLGIHPNNITAQGQMDNQLQLLFNGTFRSGRGTGQLQGNCDLTKPTFPLTLAIQGTHLEIIHLPEYKVHVTPDITLLFNYPSLQLQGNVTLPYVEVISKNSNNALTLPDEVIFVNKLTPVASPLPILLTLQLNLHLGDSVNVDYDNLKAKLLGNITIEKRPYSPSTASGELYIAQGNYTAYGQKLMIETGRLIYTGNSLMNPGLNIRAIKKVKRMVIQNGSSFISKNSLQNIPIDTESLSVGVQVAGTADNPKITLFSIPADLSQGDILSYLLLGLPQSQASNAQGSLLFTALSAYNPDASNVLGITNKLQQTFGLTELNVESVETFNPARQSAEPTTSFVIGKQITQKISIHYSIGLFNPISILNLRYQINQHWAIQSETSTIDSGADLLYGFERN